ncbi:MAG: DUF2314 domain-containing protein [Bacteroidota bacterium]
MKRLFFFILVLNSLFVIAQNYEDTTGALSEIGLYTMDTKLNEKAIKKELKAIFPGVTFIDDAPDVIDRTMIYLDIISDVEEDYPAHDMEYLQYFADGFTQTQKEQLGNSKNACIIVLYYQEKDVFTHTKKLFDWVYKKVNNTDFIVYDGEVREYYLPATWKKERLDPWENGKPNAFQLLTLHSYRMDEYCRTITFGMQRFGLPDLVIEDSPCSNMRNATQLLTIIGQLLLEGKQIQDKSLLVDLDAIKNSQFQEILATIVEDNSQRKAAINFRRVLAMEEGDPFNTIFRVNFNNKDFKNKQAYESEVYKNLFGVDDEITNVNHNDEIMAASERAKKKLPELRALFNEGLDQETLLLKAPFTTDTGGNEWMWVEVTRWNGETIKGILQNEPYYIKDLKSGAKVTVQQADIFDYILYKADGTQEGNETGKLIMKYGN